ncbi:LysM-like peptidoglycan-binding domain-containing protein [Pasteurella oralis]|uniref:LysM-like peptidoglycan-binding domain-containing protein n=1 Tax=Pasteurella oralis TaxID=1071947 RepID=A0ABW4NWX9_9PAST|nr:LysM-like peptidoglycan-binding domain-containing protein [Pasteurella oralis]
MDSEKQKPEVEHNPAQNELDLEFNQVEPITPKKVIKPEPSIFDKAKSLFAKKEQAESQFSARKEPTFSEAAIANTENDTQETTADVQYEQPEATSVAVATKINWKNPETWPMLQVLPQQHRRLFVTLLALILLLIIFFALKPSSETVQSFEQQNSNAVPIQFQPLDKQQALENSILDDLKKPQKINEPTTMPVERVQNDTTLNNMSTAPDIAVPPTTIQSTETEQPKIEQPIEIKPQPVKQPVEPQKVVEKVQAVEKPKVVEKAKVIEQTKPVEKIKPLEKVKAEKKAAPVVDAEPAKSNKGKTLTIPQGVSLMQVFRNHNLNIADVNAMTKAAGAGNALSSFKAGDKVQVAVNAQGRVTELRLENGARFIRQADGSYLYKK